MPWEKQFDRDQILDKAMRVFWTRGYEATSVQDLVDSTGVNRGSLYATYGDKHALFLAALRMYDEKMREKLLADLRARHGPREAIRELFLTFLGQVSDAVPGRGCFLTNTALELAAHDEEARQIVVRSQEQIEAFFAQAIKDGKTQGEIGSDIRAREAARGLLASLIGLIVLTRSRPVPVLLRSIVDDVMRRLV